MKFPRLVVLLMAALSLAGEAARAADAQTAQTAEVTVSPKVKVKVQAPAGWTMQVEGTTVIVKAPGDAVVSDLTFSIDAEGSVMAQKDLDGMVRDEYADDARISEDKQVSVVEMKPKSGMGAYEVFSMPAGFDEMKVNYKLFCYGRLFTGNVLVKFSTEKLNDANSAEFQQLLKMLQEGIAVEQ